MPGCQYYVGARSDAVRPAAHMMAAQPCLLRVPRPHPRLLHELAAKKNVSVSGVSGSIYEVVCMQYLCGLHIHVEVQRHIRPDFLAHYTCVCMFFTINYACAYGRDVCM